MPYKYCMAFVQICMDATMDVIFSLNEEENLKSLKTLYNKNMNNLRPYRFLRINHLTFTCSHSPLMHWLW